jgi:hypothetical protein
MLPDYELIKQIEDKLLDAEKNGRNSYTEFSVALKNSTNFKTYFTFRGYVFSVFKRCPRGLWDIHIVIPPNRLDKSK